MRGKRRKERKKNVLSSTWRFYCNANIDMSRKLPIYLYRPKWKLAFKSQNTFDEHYARPFPQIHTHTHIPLPPQRIQFRKMQTFRTIAFVRLETIIWFSNSRPNLCLLLRPQMNVFMYIWCVALLSSSSSSRSSTAQHRQQHTQFYNSPITCYHTIGPASPYRHSYVIIRIRILFYVPSSHSTKGFTCFFHIFFYILLRFFFIFIRWKNVSIQFWIRVRSSFFSAASILFIFLLRWSTIIIKCHSSPSSCCPLFFFSLALLRCISVCDYIERQKH